MAGLDQAPPPARITLVLGGARSGKSAHAEALLDDCAGPRLYIATAEARDAEMEARIAAHRARRGPRWRKVEAPLALAETLAAESRPGAALLVDCLTLWLSNLMEAGRDVAAETQRLVACLGRLEGRTVLVSNEVGLGIVARERRRPSLSRPCRAAQPGRGPGCRAGGLRRRRPADDAQAMSAS